MTLGLRLFLAALVLSYGLDIRAQAPPAPAKDYFPATWREVKSSEGRFTIHFPGEPKEETKEYLSPWGTVTLHSLFYGGENFIAYSVDYRDYPTQLSDSEVGKLYSDILVKRLDSKASLKSQKTSSVDGHPSSFIELDIGTKRLREIDVVSGRRHYTLLVITFNNHGPNTMGAENAYEKIANAFLSSFHITAGD